MKTFEFKTLGCKVNQYESQVLRERLLSLGFKESAGGPADMYVVNTCSVTQKADKESLATIRKLNLGNPGAQIFVTGCAAQNAPDKLQSLGGVAYVLGNRQKEKLPEFVLAGKEKTSFSVPEKQGITSFARHTRAFLKIQDGCDNGCAYCIIPKLRGASRSRPLGEIKKEAQSLVVNGYREIVLCGICIGAYGKDFARKGGLVKVIEELEKIDGLLRIRLSSIEATEVSPELIAAMKSSKKLCRHLHIPFQSGDDKILRLMNRRMNANGYRNLIFSLRKLFPDMGITTDIMVGFPGEDEESFAATIKFLKEVRPSRMHVFPFSPRKNTLAFSFGDTVSPAIKKERVRQVKLLSKKLSLDFSEAHIGKTVDILIEAAPYLRTGLYKGYSGNYLKVFIERAEPFINQLVKLRAIKIYADGVLAQEKRKRFP